MSLLLPLLLLLCTLCGAQGQCSLPATLVGKTMVSNTLGEIDFSQDSVVLREGLRGCALNFCPSPNLTFKCEDFGPNDEYWLMSEVQNFTLINTTVVYSFCWNLIRVTDEKWIYYQGPEEMKSIYGTYVYPELMKNQHKIKAGHVCDLPSTLPVNRYHILLDSAAMRSQSSSCPDVMLGTFEATDGSNCVTELDVCSSSTRQTVTVTDATNCSTNMFYSTDGKMDCLHSMFQNNITYVTMFTPEATNVTFSCMLLLQEGNNLYMTLSAGSCDGLTDPNHEYPLNAPNTTVYEYFLNATNLCPFHCTFPTALQGTWISTQKGEVTVNSTLLTGLYGSETQECYRTESDQYLIRTGVSTLNNEDVRTYMCLQLRQLTADMYLYYERHITKHATLNDYVVTFNVGQSLSVAQACEDLSGSPYVATRHHLLLKSGTVESSYVTCPAGLLGVFNDTVDGCKFESCTDTTKLSVTDGTCDPKPFYSGDGALGCLYSVNMSGTIYVTIHNADATTDGTNTYPYTCVAMQMSGTTLNLTQNPLECLDTQTSVSVDTNHSFTYERTETCPKPAKDTSDDIPMVLIIAVVMAVDVVVLAAVLICLYFRVKKNLMRYREGTGTEIDRPPASDESGAAADRVPVSNGEPRMRLSSVADSESEAENAQNLNETEHVTHL